MNCSQAGISKKVEVSEDFKQADFLPNCFLFALVFISIDFYSYPSLMYSGLGPLGHSNVYATGHIRLSLLIIVVSTWEPKPL